MVKVEAAKEDLCVYSESITADEIANTIFKNKDGKETRIKDVANVERYARTCTGQLIPLMAYLLIAEQ